MGRQVLIAAVAGFIRHFRLFLAVLFVLPCSICGAQTPAHAPEPLLEVLSLRIAGDMNRARIIATFNRKPDYETLLLANPPRLVVSLPVAIFPDAKKIQQKAAFVTDLRYGLTGNSHARIILAAKSPFRIENSSVKPLQNNVWQMVIDLAATPEESFKTAILAQQQENQLKKPDSQMTSSVSHAGKPFVVVVDAGHGAFDTGATGVNGTREKDITLAVALALAEELQQAEGIRVSLTRQDDMFLRLNERVARARAAQADLFISIHADHIDTPALRGATVYTLSDNASDTIARKLAEDENKADLLDGLPPDRQTDVDDILIDLARRETQAFSIDFAGRIIDIFGRNNINLIKNPHRHASFQVLRAPDIPSVLIELGYLSNPDDEKLITSPQWRRKMAKLIAKSIYDYKQVHFRQP